MLNHVFGKNHKMTIGQIPHLSQMMTIGQIPHLSTGIFLWKNLIRIRVQPVETNQKEKKYSKQVKLQNIVYKCESFLNHTGHLVLCNQRNTGPNQILSDQKVDYTGPNHILSARPKVFECKTCENVEPCNFDIILVMLRFSITRDCSCIKLYSPCGFNNTH
jgi:hypothetical protein